MIRILLLILLLIPTVSFSQSEGWAICNSGANLYFKIVGTGEPVLIISDAGNSSVYMMDLVTKLSENHKVIYYDARATGKSRLPVIHDSTVNFKKAVADIDGLRAVLRIPKWSVIAHGFGAMIASVYAGMYTQNVQNLLLINPDMMDQKLLNPDPFADTYEEYDFSPMLKQSVLTKRFDNMMQKLMTQVPPKDTLTRWQLINEFQAGAYVYDTINESLAFNYLQERTKNVNIKRRLREGWNPHFSSVVRKYQSKVLVVFSKKRRTLKQVTKSWKDSLQHSKVIIIEKSYHFPWADNPNVFYSEIKSSDGRSSIRISSTMLSSRRVSLGRVRYPS